MRTFAGVLMIVGIVVLLVWVVVSIGASMRAQKTVKSGKPITENKSKKVDAIIRICGFPLAILLFGGGIAIEITVTNKTPEPSKPNTSILEQETSISQPPTSDNESYSLSAKPFTERVQEQISTAINDYKDKFDNVIISYNSEVGVNIIMNCYDTYAFAQIAKASTDEAKKIIIEEEIEKYHLMISTPQKDKHNLFWYSTDLESGVLTDNGYDGKFEKVLTVDEILERYQVTDSENSEQTNETIVFIASSGNGNKYHRKKTCSGMNGNVTSITLEKAKAQGYSACKICY